MKFGVMNCIGEPISWLRLERFALGDGGGGGGGAVHDHLAACAACARCLDEIRGDLVALPPLAMPERRRPWWARPRRWLAPALALAAAAAVALVLLRGGGGTGGPGEPAREDVARVKGVGEVVLGVVRERGGVIRDDDVRTFAPGDRWKIVVTCPPAASAWVDVAVYDAGQIDAEPVRRASKARTGEAGIDAEPVRRASKARTGEAGIDRPLQPARIGCGNRIALPGAFSLGGDRPQRVCVRIAADAAPDPARQPDACVTLRPE